MAKTRCQGGCHCGRVRISGLGLYPPMNLESGFGRQRERYTDNSMAIEDIKNFLLVGERLGTGGQPTEGQFSEVAAAGYEVVVNLGLLDPRYCLPDEAGLVVDLDMEYRHIPVKFDDPRLSDFERFTETMSSLSTRKVFVHCAANLRVSTFIALHQQLRRGWSSEKADLHLKTFWEPNQTWTKFVAACREHLSLAPVG